MAEVQWGILGDTAQLGNTFLKAYEAGNSMRIAKGKESALARYATDPEGAASELMRYDPDAALELQKRTAGNQAAADRRRVLGSYQADPKAARQQAYATGDKDLIEMLNGMDETTRAQTLDRAKQTFAIVNKLGELTYDQRKAALQRLGPALVDELGMDPAQIAALDPTDEWIMDRKIEGAQFEEKAQLFNSGGDIVSARPGARSAQVLYDAPEKDDAPNGYRWGDASKTTLIAIPGGPADPRVAGDLASRKRAPVRARVGRGSSSGGAKLPKDYVLDGE
jgi:hypothetical protein